MSDDNPSIPEKPPGAEPPENIGSAFMRDDGVIEMMLSGYGPDDIHGEALIRVWPSEERYAGIQAHLDNIQPGEHRTVRPFPEAE